MIEITRESISPELVVNKIKTDSSGCVVTYIGLIREYSRGKPVLSDHIICAIEFIGARPLIAADSADVFVVLIFR